MKTIKLFILLCFSLALNAQNNSQKRNELSLMTGIGMGQWKDLSYSPLSYKLGHMPTELRFQHFSKKGHILDFELQGWAGTLEYDPYENFETQLLGLDFKAQWLGKLGEANGCTLYLGPRYKLGSQMITWEDDLELSSAYSYLSTSNLGITARVDYTQQRWSFSAEASLPLIASNSRPAYSGFTDEDSDEILNFLFDDAQWQGPDTYFAPELGLQASYQIFNWADITAKYEGAYTHVSDSEKIAFATHQFMFGLKFKF
ncbi:hypothetical protein [Owenweeksia hongkongensis]|uniref:hypothetical protein n=1 Tax=Owenweeksia hongkongensis TaxID=253245 RepID=UPI003A915FB4